ncbi:conserved hypothetical protein [Trichinella spiralis]|uniref:hypothetical protein n=1 Tax=Trichinella spiralis TaxID=6334 RepID=UPI0001EFD850|nr:conserved hypothetical protein [Trichinella spiralis]
MGKMGNTTITWKKSISKLVDTVPRQPTNRYVEKMDCLHCLYVYSQPVIVIMICALQRVASPFVYWLVGSLRYKLKFIIINSHHSKTHLKPTIRKIAQANDKH